tara:strand:+ start:1400 stop:2071 length:672 start_codon:yes stop_codon:yes gene_type:complete
MDIKIKAVLEKLFRAYNRRPTDQALENYLEFTDGYSFHAIKEAVNRHVDAGGTMPNPADVKNTCRSVVGPRPEQCAECDGKGYKQQEEKKDKYGFDYIDAIVSCFCKAPHNKTITDQNRAKAHSFGRILARTIAVRSVSNEMTVPKWILFWWSKDGGQGKWALLGTKIDNMQVLNGAAEFAEKAKPDDCAFYAFDIAKDAIRYGKKIFRQGQAMGKGSFTPFR